MSGNMATALAALGSPIKRIPSAYAWLVVDPDGNVWAGNEYKQDAMDAFREIREVIPAGSKVMSKATYKRTGTANRAGPQKDKRISCPFCNVKTWSNDYVQFMSDHDRPDGRRCLRAAESVGTANRSGSTRDYSYIVFPSTRVEGEGHQIHGHGRKALRDAVMVAKSLGYGAGVYDVSRGAFAGYVTASGRWKPFTYSGQLRG